MAAGGVLVAWAPQGLPQALAAPAEAAGEQALACVRSNASGAVHFQYRWEGDGGWRSVKAPRSGWVALARRASDDGQLPGLLVRYDDDPGAGENVVGQRVRVERATRADCQQPVAPHAFNVRDDELFLDAEGSSDAEAQATTGPRNNRLAESDEMV